MAEQDAQFGAARQPMQQAESFRSIWRNWLFSLSKELQPIFKQTIVFSGYILCDLFILWLVGFAFLDITQTYPIMDLLYNGLKIASVCIISVHFLISCFVEMKKEKQRAIPSEDGE